MEFEKERRLHKRTLRPSHNLHPPFSEAQTQREEQANDDCPFHTC